MVERVENILDKHSTEEMNDLLNLQTRANYLESLQSNNPSPAITRALQVTQRAIQTLASSPSPSSSSSPPSSSSGDSGEHLSLLENAEAKTDGYTFFCFVCLFLFFCSCLVWCCICFCFFSDLFTIVVLVFLNMCRALR